MRAADLQDKTGDPAILTPMLEGVAGGRRRLGEIIPGDESLKSEDFSTEADMYQNLAENTN